MSQIDRIRRRLDVFLASSLDTRVPARMSLGEIAEFETYHGVRLPGDFAQFLKEIGTGGPGPHAWDEGSERSGFALMSMWFEAVHAVTDMRAGLVAERSVLSPSKTFDDYVDRAEPVQGCITIGDANPGYVLLVISGPNSGRLAYYWPSTDESAWITSNGSSEPSSFLDWYEDWLVTRNAVV
jgi:hypothetical protein